ncbi:response regulator [bacterium (Candidatus Gribaldobacteria) CG_4_10_14_0_2_um_filter_41_16]|uniref:Response regulator n=3 Tax=Candidatus Gribaldobacteria TaxID=2798536 RepID=A0A2M7VIU6_9BACT|nr:MAG: response regulator [bacterium (Candidatus Gribaldobacteria) CG02_land_8_20_14_3_00_41_15]PIX03317.1 MAG: response regulator [bacterium (Candidatus Gribaldobacteria) CG_4_8_14_3_um_filter_42_11]PJA01777.1 MAG: response regulator [bacterium (Candidatus Gribaldobacteria) CG_4_10_14_0_2_um_filter_41_16]
MANKKILLIEDDPFLVDIYSKKLRQAGFEVVCADAGKKALELFAKDVFDLVLLDLVMPNIDGWKILSEIKKPPVQSETKVIIFSNLGQKIEVERGLQMGADKYLIKANYTPSEVVEEVRKLITNNQ